MKKTDALALITGLQMSINNMLPEGRSLKFSDEFAAGDGATPDHFDKDHPMVVGCIGLGFTKTDNGTLEYPLFQRRKDLFFRNSEIKDVLVTSVLVGSGHEYRHEEQQDNDFHGKIVFPVE